MPTRNGYQVYYEFRDSSDRSWFQIQRKDSTGKHLRPVAHFAHDAVFFLLCDKVFRLGSRYVFEEYLSILRITRGDALFFVLLIVFLLLCDRVLDLVGDYRQLVVVPKDASWCVP